MATLKFVASTVHPAADGVKAKGQMFSQHRVWGHIRPGSGAGRSALGRPKEFCCLRNSLSVDPRSPSDVSRIEGLYRRSQFIDVGYVPAAKGLVGITQSDDLSYKSG